MSIAYRGQARVKGYKRTELDGYSFASKLEAALYVQSKLEQSAGEIVIEKLQDHVYLSDARILYIPDMRVYDKRRGCQVWREAKGFENERWPIIKKLWGAYGPGPLEIYKGTYARLRLAETINPRGGNA